MPAALTTGLETTSQRRPVTVAESSQAHRELRAAVVDAVAEGMSEVEAARRARVSAGDRAEVVWASDTPVKPLHRNT